MDAHQIRVYRFHKELATEITGLPGTPIPLVDLCPNEQGLPGGRHAARRIKVVAGSGTVTVNMSGGDGVVLTMASAEEELGEFLAITAVSGITNIRASW